MKTRFNDGWQFAKLHFDDADFSLPDAKELLSLPDVSFSPVSIPHDWLIWNTNDLYENSVGIYRKRFHLSDIDFCKNSRTIIRFDGVYMDTSVFVNGVKTTEWKYGYTSFETDITSFLKDGENTITVVSVYRSPNTRWYSGAGIFRDVWMISVPEAHLVSDGVYFNARQHSDGIWACKIRAEACYLPIVSKTKSKQAVVRFQLADEAGVVVAEMAQPVTLNPITTEDPYWYLDPAGASEMTAELQVKDGHLWEIDMPYLYTLTVELYETTEGTSTSGKKALSADNSLGKLLDSCIQKVGLRTLRLDPDKGFFLNNKHIPLRGVNQHHDLGALGSAFNLAALKRQFTKLRDMGVNAIRLSHNPPSPALLELADETGMLLIDEAFDMWEQPKNKYDYSRFFPAWHARDVASWIRRDRNHPSIIMWSIGNEIHDTHEGNGLAVTKDLVALVKKHDPEKNAAITIGSNYLEWQGAQDCAEELDAVGYNYTEKLYKDHHAKHPAWCIYGSETSSTVQSRGVYHFPANDRTLIHEDGQCSSLGNCSVDWGARDPADAIIKTRDEPYVLGEFLWSGWDYIGEPTPYSSKNSFFGQIDTAGFEKDSFYQYQAEWTDYRIKPMVHLLPYWNFEEGKLIDIRAYTNAPSVELLCNGKSCGIQTIDHAHGKKLAGEWQLPFSKGSITAIARDESGRELARESRITPGEPARLVVKADRQRFEGPHDLIFIEISIADKNGNPVDTADNRISVSVSGACLEGLDNGDSTDYEQYKTDNRKLFNDKLIAIIAPERENIHAPVSVTVSSQGFTTVTLTLNAAEEQV